MTYRLTTVVLDHRGQKLVGEESPAKASFARINSATYKPIAKGYLRSHTPLLRRREPRLGFRAVQPFPHEPTSNHDDPRLPIVEERVTLYPEPLGED